MDPGPKYGVFREADSPQSETGNDVLAGLRNRAKMHPGETQARQMRSQAFQVARESMESALVFMYSELWSRDTVFDNERVRLKHQAGITVVVYGSYSQLH